jgi:hypothetical protein
MNCRRARSLLLEHLEARLSGDAEVSVRAHLASCSRCRTEFELFRRTLLLAAGNAVPPMPISADIFLGKVRRRIRTFDLQRSRFSVRRSLWPTLAAAMVMLAVGVLFLSRKPQAQLPQDDIAITGESIAADLIDQAGTESDLIRQIDTQSISQIETELADNAELDDLIEELTPRQQEDLIKELTRLYRAPAKSLNGG